MPARSSGDRPRVLVVVGTRPEAIKMAPVVRALGRREGQLETRLALTGQHDELVDQVLRAFGMSPDFDLGIMRAGQDLYDVAHACLYGLKGVIEGFLPDLVLVQGDTASVFFGSLAAFFEKVGVGHVEAGLRSRHGGLPYPDPFPEENVPEAHRRPHPASLRTDPSGPGQPPERGSSGPTNPPHGQHGGGCASGGGRITPRA